MEQDYQTRLFGYRIIRKGIFFWSLILFFGNLISVKAQNCTVNAGVLNETICAIDPMMLQGNSPAPIIGTAKWTQIGGPSVTITSPNSPTTTVTGYTGGNTYVFRYSAICGDGVVAFQDKTVIVVPITVANAGANIASCPNSTGSIAISGNAPQNPGETGHWEITGANNAGVVMNFPTSATTTLTLPTTSCGVSTLTWVITGPEYSPGKFCSSSSSINVTNYGGVTPVSAGSDITLTNCYTTTQNVNLNGSFGGCGLNGQMGTWTFVSGPNTPIIGNPNSSSTNVSNLQEGTYVLRWTVVGPCASGSDEVTITVPAATQDVTVLPGGTERIYFCDPTINQVTLSAPAPLYAGETVLWTQIGGTTLPPGSIQSPASPTTLVTNISDAGDPYTFRYTLTNSNTGCVFTKDYVVEYKESTRTISVNGGEDLYGNCEQTQFTIPIVVTGTGYNRYRILDGPIGSPLGPFPTAPLQIGETSVTLPDLTVPGTYSLQFARTEDGNLPVGCDYGFDSIAVIVSAQATPSNAGSDVSLNCGMTAAPLEGVGTTAEGTSYWTQLSGPNEANIVDHTAQNTMATGLIPGTYEFQYITKGGGSRCPFSTDNVTVYVSSGILSTVSAGPDQGACINSQLTMNGSIPASGEYGIWSQVSGPDVIVFADSSNPTTMATGFLTAGGTNVLRWTIGYLHPGTSGCSTPISDDISVLTSVDMAGTVAMAGTDACYPTNTTTINLNANTPAVGEQGTWTVNPSAGVVFADNHDPQTAVTIPGDNFYKFIWTITLTGGSCGNSSDSVEVTVAENPATAGAGPDQSVCGTTVTMAATLSSGAVGVWSRVSGFGDYTISNVTDPNAVFTFESSGPYVFRWTVTAGSCSTASDDVRILLGVPPQVANAGPDQEICNGTSATMAGSSYNEFFEGGEWSLLAGAPNIPLIVDPMDPNTVINNLVEGKYVFRWKVTSTENFLCPISFDDVIIEVAAPASAGSDATYCDVSSVQLIGSENSTGTWTLTSGNPVGVTITQSPSNSYVANATVVPGNTYVFTYTTSTYSFTSGNTCPGNSDTVTVTVNSGASVQPDAGPDQTICTTDVGGIITLNGNTKPIDVTTSEWEWVLQPGTSVANITDINDPGTQVTGLTVPGLYILKWVFKNSNGSPGGGGSCRDLSDIVRINVFQAPSQADAGPDDTVACQRTYTTNAVAPTAGIGRWSFAIPADDPSGGQAVIDSPNNPQTTLSNVTTLGTYILTWTVTNGPFTNPSTCQPSVDQVSVIFNDVPPSIANAGPDKELCAVTQTNLAAVPLTQGVGTWTQTLGTLANIASPNDPATLVFGLTTGVYEFTWTAATANNDGCSSSDTMRIEIYEQPINANAGPDQTLPQFAPVTLGATPPTVGQGQWVKVSGTSSVVFSDVTSPTTAVSGLDVGTTVFEWRVTNGPCAVATDQVSITIIANTDLELIKSVTPNNVNVGSEVTFIISVFNNPSTGGTVDATGVGVKDLLPDGYTIVPGSVSNGGVYNIGDSSISWSNLNVTLGALLDLTFKATVNATGNYVNSAEIVACNQFDIDSTPNNNIPTEDDQDDATISIQSADLSLQKSVVPTLVSIGDNVVFTVVVSNSGPNNATNVSVRDQLPVGYTYVSDTGAGAYNDATGIWTVGTLNNGNSSTLTITATVKVTTVVNGYQNTAQVITSDQIDPDSTPNNNVPTEDDQDAAVITLQNADLELDKTVSPTSTTAGGVVTFTLALTNNGPGNATGVEIKDYLPNGYTLVSGSVSNGGTYDAASSTLLWQNLSLANGGALNLTFDATVNATGTYVNTAEVTKSDLPDPDSTPNNNIPTEDDQDDATIVIESADLWLQKTVVPTVVSIGDNVVFTVVVTNSGPNNATNVSVRDQLPVGYTYVSDTGAGAYNDATGIWTVGNLNNGNSATLTITATVKTTTVANGYQNTAQVITSDQNDPDSTPNNNVPTEDDQDDATVTLQVADLELAKTVSPISTTAGGVVTFTLALTNNGPGNATGVEIKDYLPNGYTLVAGSASNGGTYDAASSTLLWQNLSLANGGALNLTFDATVNATGTYVNTAEVTKSDLPDPDSTPNNNIPTEDDQDDATIVIESADLSLQKSVVPTIVSIGDNVVFTVIVTNSGPNNATNVSVKDQLPVGYTYVSDTGAGAYNDATGIWTIGTLNNGNSSTLTITAAVKATAVANGYQNIAQVITSDQNDPDSTPNNNVTTEDDQDDATVTLQNADLELEKTVAPTSVTVGGVVTFTLALTNKGPGNATGVDIKDYLPNGYTLVSGSVSNGGTYDAASSTLLWQNLSLANGGALNLTFDATANATGTYVNTAEVTKSDLPDPDSTPNNDDGDQSEDDESAATITILPNMVDLSLTKTVVNNTLTPLVGSQISFEIRVNNSSLNTATGVQIKDKIPTGYSYVLFSSTSGTYNDTTGVWDVGVVNPGTTEILLLTVNVNATGDYLNIAEVTACDQPDIDSTPNNGVTTEDDYDTAIVAPVSLAADLSLTKTIVGGNTTPLVGSQISFEVIVTNGGPQDATGVQVTDKLPTGYMYAISNTSAGTYDASSGVWDIGGLPKGESETLVITATVNATGDYLNIAEVTASDLPDPDSTPNNGVVTEDDYGSVTITPIAAVADLSLTKTIVGGNTTPLVGSQISFEVIVTNDGPQDTAGVQVVDKLPTGYTYVSSTLSAGTYNPTNGLWNIGGLPNGQSQTLTITAIVNATGDYLNIAEVTTSSLPDPDSTPNNGNVTEDDYGSVTITPIATVADLSLTKTIVGGNTTPLVGSQISFEVIVTNGGPQDVTGVQVTDKLPTGYTYSSATPSAGTYDATTGFWNIGGLPNGQSETLVITATVNATGDYLNIAEVTASSLPDPDSTPNNGVVTEDDYGSVTVLPVAAMADLSLAKTIVGGNTSPLFGSQVSFEIVVTNSGPQDATGVQVTESLPTGYTFASATPSAGTYNAGNGVWNVGGLPNGQSQTLTITATVNATGNYTNVAEVTASSLPDPDSTPNNGDITEDDYANVVVTPVSGVADLSLTKTIVGGNTTALVGSEVTFEVIVTNSGPQDVTGVQVGDKLPTGFTYTRSSISTGTYDATTGIWNVGGLINGKSETLTVSGTVNATGDYANIAEVTASSLPDPDSTPNNGVTTEDDYGSVTVTPTNLAADLSLTKTIVGGNTTALVGSEVTFEVIVTNSGPQDVTGVQVGDKLPTGFTYTRSSISTGTYDATTGIWNVGGLINGKSETLTVSGTVNATGDYLNIAEVTASSLPDPDSTPNNGVTTEDDYGSVTVTPTSLAADLSLTKTIVGGNTTALVGSEVTFEVIVTNSGPQDVTGVQVTDKLPTGFTYTRSSISTGTYDATTGVWNVGGLINGKSETLTVSGTVNATGDYLNIAEVTASSLPDPDSTPNNGVTTEDDYGSVTVTPTNLAADLSLTKTIVGGNTTALVGSEVTFEVIITNSGPQDVTGVQVGDKLPTGFTYTRSSISTGTYDATTGIWNVGGLINGKSETLTVSGTVNAIGDYLNIAEVTASSLPDPDSTPNNGVTTEDDYGSVTVTPISLAADLSLTKTIVGGNTTVLVGSEVTFEVIVTNSGPQDVTGVQVGDKLPTGFTYTRSSISTGTYDATTGVWNVGGLINGKSETLTVSGTVNATGDYLNIAEVTASSLPDPDSTPNNGVTTEDDYGSVTVIPTNLAADLSLTKTIVGGNTTALVGSEVTFEVIVTNSGPQDVTGVQVGDKLPTGFTYTRSSISTGTYDATTGVWNVGGLINGKSETLTVSGTVNATGDYANIAEVTASSLPDPDSTPNNGDATEDDYGSVTVTPTSLAADLSLTKTIVGGNTTALVGSEVTFEVIVTNSGPQDVTGVQVGDKLPTGFTYTRSSISTGTYDATTGIWNVGGLINGKSETLTVSGTVNATGDYLNVAEVTASSLPDPDSTPNNGDITEDDYGSVTVTPTSLAADLSLTKTIVGGNTTALVGSEVTFEVIVTNSGPQDVTGVQVTDKLPTGFTYTRSSISTGTYDATTGVWNVGGLINGKSETLMVSGTVNATGDYANIAEVTASSLPDPDSTPNNGDATEDDYGSVTVTPTNLAADLALTKTLIGGNTSPAYGTSVTFQITVNNKGPQGAGKVQVTDKLPSGYTYVVFSSTAGVYNEVTGIWDVGAIANGASETLLITAIVNTTGDYRNTAEVFSSDLPDPNSTPNNGVVTEDDISSVILTPVNTIADLSLEKLVVDDMLTPLVGSQITFQITLMNSGPNIATGVEVKDLLPAGYTFVFYNASSGSYNRTTGIWNPGIVLPNSSQTLLINVLVNAPTGTVDEYLNITEVTAADDFDPDSTPNNGITTEDDYDSISVTPIIVMADLSIEKTIIGNQKPNVGDIVTFQVKVKNDGPGNATGVEVKDLLPSGFAYMMHSATSGTYTFADGRWNVGSILNGNEQILLINATVKPATGAANEYLNITEVTASALPDPDSTPNNGVTTEDDYDSILVDVQLANLSLEKTVSNVKANVNEVVTFTVQVNNAGPVVATGVAVEDLLPIGYSNITNITGGGIYSGFRITWSNLQIPLSGLTLTFQATVETPNGLKDSDYVNTAQVTASDQFDPNSTPDNDDGDQSEDDEDNAFIESPKTDIAIIKTVDATDPPIDALINFTITADNIGSLKATNLEVQDILPTGYQFVSSSTSSGTFDAGTGIWKIPAVDVNSVQTLTLKVKVRDVKDYLNTAKLVALDQIDTNASNNQSSATIEPACLKIHNEFSPNDDGVNDVFYIDCIANYPNNVLEIYNRWGNLIYTQQGYKNTWDGTADGSSKLLPVGTYFYILDLGDGTPKTSGWLYLKR